MLTRITKATNFIFRKVLYGVSPDKPWNIFAKPLHNSSLKKHKLTHVSLFSGCGGFDLGFYQAGFKTIFANDIDLDSCETYRENMGEILTGDITDIPIPNFNHPIDVLTAGFPCQPFSNAGSRKGLKDDRGMLYTRAIAFVKKIKPKIVIFENVRGLLSSKMENGDLLIGDICAQLDKLGYHVTFSLLNASNYNVPQKRLRVFIVGVEKKYKDFFSFQKPQSGKYKLELEHVILDIKDREHNQSERMQPSPLEKHIGSMIPEGGSWKNIPYKKLPERMKKIRDNVKRYRAPNFYRKFHRTEISGTITAAFKPENAGVWHPIKKCFFSVREIARIQSFPDWFKFEGRNIKSKYQQIGNAVPPRLAYEIACQIRNLLLGKNSCKEKEHLTYDIFVKAGKPLKACSQTILFKK